MRAPAIRTGSAAPVASRRVRRGTVRPPGCGRWEAARSRCAARSSRAIRLVVALSSSPPLRQRVSASSVSAWPSSRMNAPRAAPSSAGRPRPSPCQNGKPAGTTVRGRDQHPVERDLLDPPTGGTECEHIADPRFVDHLLVEFADPGVLLADHEHGEQSAVGDGAAGGDGESLRARAPGERAGVAVPHQPRP